MGAIQGVIEFTAGLLIIAMLLVLLQPVFDTIGRLCLGMGGFAASTYTLCVGSKETAMWLTVFVLGLNALLHSMGLSITGILRKV